MKRKASIMVFLLSITISLIISSPPRELSFQGKLVGVSSPVDLTFKIFDTEAVGTGSELWSESHAGTSLDGAGLFNVILGQSTTINLDFD